MKELVTAQYCMTRLAAHQFNEEGHLEQIVKSNLARQLAHFLLENAEMTIEDGDFDTTEFKMTGAFLTVKRYKQLLKAEQELRKLIQE